MEDLPEYVGVARAADLLGQKRSNVAKFLDGKGLAWTTGPDGRLWKTEDVLEAKRQRETDEKKVDADERRRKAALGTPAGRTRRVSNGQARRIVIGPTQRVVMMRLLDSRVTGAQLESDGERMALSRLMGRDLVKAIDGRPRSYELTSAGKELARGFTEE